MLYAGGQPSPGVIDYLIVHYRVKTIVNLRGHEPDADWWQAEHDMCLRRGVRMLDIPLAEVGRAAEGCQEFLAIMSDPTNHPVYVHCEAGSVRTGLSVAAYRMGMQGWDLESAMREAELFRYSPSGRQAREYEQVLMQLDEGSIRPKLHSAPSSAKDH